MSLYIIDNGEDYDDHAIYFVKTEWPSNVVEAVVAAINSGTRMRPENYRVMGVCPDPTWWGDDPSQALEQLPRLGSLVGERRNPLLRTLPIGYLRGVLLANGPLRDDFAPGLSDLGRKSARMDNSLKEQLRLQIAEMEQP